MPDCRAVRLLGELLAGGPNKMTQEQIAEIVGVEQQTVSQWLHGKHKPKSAAVIGRLQERLGISATDWIPDEERKPQRQKRAAGAR